MTAWAIAYVRRHSHSLARARDYLELTKPRIAALVLLTVAAGAWLGAWGPANPLVVLHALIGTALVAASGSAINQWLERASDARMPRTANRPLPAGRLSDADVLSFAALSVLTGIAYLALLVNLRTAVLALATWFLYSFVYTPLKARSVYNTAVGAVAGALPILIGWSAADGRLGVTAGALFMIVYLWQFPHFMAIAWIYRDDYMSAGLRMIPSIDPDGTRTGAQAVAAALALLPVSLVPALTHVTTLQYALAALCLGLAYLAASLLFLVYRNPFSARLLLRVSLFYLPGLLGALSVAPLLI
jgi:protoheme IX farnesyltransferase